MSLIHRKTNSSIHASRANNLLRSATGRLRPRTGPRELQGDPLREAERAAGGSRDPGQGRRVRREALRGPSARRPDLRRQGHGELLIKTGGPSAVIYYSWLESSMATFH